MQKEGGRREKGGKKGEKGEGEGEGEGRKGPPCTPLLNISYIPC